MFSDNERFIIALDSLNIEYKNKFFIYEKTGNKPLKEKISFCKEYLKELLSKEDYKTGISVFEDKYVDYLISNLLRDKIKIITIESEFYPNKLMQIENPPIILYAKGNTELLNEKAFAIVGSRKSLPLSINLAEEYANELSDSGFTLVTGIAEGVDITVLKTALRKNAKVISVICGGFNNIYPKSHQNIFDEVAKNGLVISENSVDTVSKPFMFPIRNRIIAGLSDATLIVNGGLKSGTLYTAEYTLENGRDLFVIPYSIGVKSGEGNNYLLKNGATITVSPKDILEYLGVESKPKIEQILNDQEKLIIKAMENGASHLEEISSKTQLEFNEVCTLISMMEIKKLVVKDGVNEYSLCK